MFRIVWVFACFAMILGCSGSRNDQMDATGSEKAVFDPTPVRQSAALPFGMKLSGERSGDQVMMTLILTYRTRLEAAPVLELIPGENTEVLDIPLVEDQAIPEDPCSVTKQFRLKGENPTLKAVLSLKGTGGAAGVQAVYPPKKNPVTRINSLPSEVPLPAPIEVEGVQVESGIQVHP
ncbi:MAG: hypothetical protein IJM59_03070 [Proteobacteria bacterium]|nr:hypothetical protein [Pseudomonadota bacterium]